MPRAASWSTTPAMAETVVVNTCGFVEQAKKDSIDTLLEAADLRTAGHARPSSPSAAWPSGTARNWPPSCPRLTPSSASTTTPTIGDRLRAVLAAGRTCRTSRGTGDACCR